MSDQFKALIINQEGDNFSREVNKLLKSCGINIENGNYQLKVEASNFPLEIMYLRNSDIQNYLEDGVIDVAIVGENLLIK